MAYDLQERRRVEEVYVQGLRKLANKHPPDDSSDLGYTHLSIGMRMQGCVIAN